MKAVLTDFNGTLYNDSRLHVQAWQRFVGRKLNMTLSEEEIAARFIGPSNPQIFREFLGFSDATDEEIHALGGEKEADYRAVARSKAENLQLVDGVAEMLDLLKEKNIPVAMATSSVYENVQFYLNDLGMSRWFTLDRIVYDDWKLPPKPNPAYYLEAARRIGVDIADCAILEDSPTGIRAALNAKAERVIVIDTSMPAAELKAAFGDAITIVHNFRNFERFL